MQVAQAGAKAEAKGKKAEAAKAPETRNWADVDTNKDGLVSPDEMAAYLKANPGPLAPK